MKRELSYREEMVQQLQIVRGWSLSVRRAYVDYDCKADVDQCSLSLWGGTKLSHKRVMQAVSINRKASSLYTETERKSDTCILKPCQFSSGLFPVNSVFFSPAVE